MTPITKEGKWDGRGKPKKKKEKYKEEQPPRRDQVLTARVERRGGGTRNETDFRRQSFRRTKETTWNSLTDRPIISRSPTGEREVAATGELRTRAP